MSDIEEESLQLAPLLVAVKRQIQPVRDLVMAARADKCDDRAQTPCGVGHEVVQLLQLLAATGVARPLASEELATKLASRATVDWTLAELDAVLACLGEADADLERMGYDLREDGEKASYRMPPPEGRKS